MTPTAPPATYGHVPHHEHKSITRRQGLWLVSGGAAAAHGNRARARSPPPTFALLRDPSLPVGDSYVRFAETSQKEETRVLDELVRFGGVDLGAKNEAPAYDGRTGQHGMAETRVQ